MLQSLIQLENDEFLLAEGPITLVDGESMKNNARFMQNLDEKLREKVCEKMQNGSRSEIFECVPAFSVRLMLLYDALNTFANHD